MTGARAVEPITDAEPVIGLTAEARLVPADTSSPPAVSPPPADINAGVRQPQPSPPIEREANPLSTNFDEEEEEHPFAEIARFCIGFQKLKNEIERDFSDAQKLEQTAPRHRASPMEAPAALEQTMQEEAEVADAETSANPLEAAAEFALMLREFVSPAGTVFLVRDSDWTDANAHGSTNVPLCDVHGQNIELDPSKAQTKTTMRMSYAQTYEQALIEAIPVPTMKPKRRGRGR